MDKDVIAIKDIRDGMKNINVLFIVLDLISSSKTKDNRDINNFKVADQSACINCVIWDEPGKHLQPGDIIKISRCYAKDWKDCLNISSGKASEITRMGDFMMVFNENLNMSEPKKCNEAPSSPLPSPSNKKSENSRFHPRKVAIPRQSSYMESPNCTPRSPLSNSNAYSSNSSQSSPLNNLKHLSSKICSKSTKVSANDSPKLSTASQSSNPPSNNPEPRAQKVSRIKFFSPKPTESSYRNESPINSSQSSSTNKVSGRNKLHPKLIKSPKPTIETTSYEAKPFGRNKSQSPSSNSFNEKTSKKSFEYVICLSDSD